MIREDFIVESQYKTNNELAEEYGVSKRTIRRWKQQCRNNIPTPKTKVYDDFLKVTSNRALVLGDVEVPCHSVDTLEMACELAKKYNLDTLIINGDLIALDSFSTWARNTVYKLAFKDELEPTVEIVKIFLGIFESVYLVTGNHERRLAHKLDGEITIADFFVSLARVRFSEYSYCTLQSGDREILVCHQDNYSKQPLAIARELASVHHKNIIAGHTHHLAKGYDKSGKFWIVDGGCCRDVRHTEYKATRINTFPKWNNGVVMVLDGQPFLVDQYNAEFWLT
jgi:predicted phosphodiesterase